MADSNRVLGGLKTAEKNRQYNKDFYKIIGRKGGKMSHGGGFADNPDFAREMGLKGAEISLRVRREKAALK